MFRQGASNNKKNYLEDIISSVNELSPYISYRFWTLDNNKMDNKSKEYIKILKEVYNKEEIYGIIYLVYSALIVLVDYIKSRECCKTKTYSF